MSFHATIVRVDQPPDLHGDSPATVTVISTGERMALERGDVSWSSWVIMSAAPAGSRIDILVRK